MSTLIDCKLYVRFVVSEGRSVPLCMGLRYEAADPYAVRAAFHIDGDNTVEWLFARELLAEGLHRPTGSGAVRVWPARGHERHTVRIALLSPAGEALFEAPVAAVESFLTRTHAAVPPGTESDHLDLDDQLAHILAVN